jgi:hypothetical protein
VQLDTKSGTYLVDGFDGKRHAVLLDPPSCSCIMGNSCMHVASAMLSTRTTKPPLQRQNISLSQIIKKTRGRKKLGRKGPIAKSELNITCAPDSLQASSLMYNPFFDPEEAEELKKFEMEENLHAVDTNLLLVALHSPKDEAVKSLREKVLSQNPNVI